MALESPAYVISAASHSATLFRQTAQSMLLSPGIVGPSSLQVTANGTPNMTVNVAPGVAWIPGTLGATAGMLSNPASQGAYGLPSSLTSQGCYCAYNDGTVNLPIAAADPANPRIDIVCASVQDAQYAGSNNQPLLQVVTGTAAPSPSVPLAPASTVVLAQVAVAAGVASITTGNISDERYAAGAASGTLRATYSRGAGSTNFASGTFTFIMGVTLPATWPAGIYLVTATMGISSTSTSYLQTRVLDPASNNLSGDIQTPAIGTGITGIHWSRAVPITPNGQGVNVQVNVSAGTPSVNNAMSFLDVTFLGAAV